MHLHEVVFSDGTKKIVSVKYRITRERIPVRSFQSDVSEYVEGRTSITGTVFCTTPFELNDSFNINIYETTADVPMYRNIRDCFVVESSQDIRDYDYKFEAQSITDWAKVLIVSEEKPEPFDVDIERILNE